MDGTTRLKVVDLNKNLTCVLCKGYLIDATTIIECLHSFCRTCIVTYLKTNKSCPACDTVVHKTRPHQNIRSDKSLQDLVYKLIPGLYKDEMRRRREFYSAHYEDAPKRPGEERGDEMCDRFIFTSDEQISLALHFCPREGDDAGPKHKVFKTREEYKSRLENKTKESIDVRYLQCQGAVTVGLLKKFLRLKYNLPADYQIDMFNNDDLVPDTLSLADVAYGCCWRRKAPLMLSYSIYQTSVKTIKWGEPIPKLTHSTCHQWHPAMTTAPTTATSSAPLPQPKEAEEKIQIPELSHAPSSSKSNPTPSAITPEPPSVEIKQEIKSPPNGVLQPKSSKLNSSQSKSVENVERKSKSVNGGKTSKKSSLLGKRPATKSPVRIAPAPSKDGPVLKMPKMLKLETNVQNSLSSSSSSSSSSSRVPLVQQVIHHPSSSSFTPTAASSSAPVPFFPLVSSNFLPAQLRSGQASFVKAFPTGFMAISTVSSKPGTICGFAPSNAKYTSTPANISRTLTGPTPSHGQPRSISKALSSLSLSSPPLPSMSTVTSGSQSFTHSFSSSSSSSTMTTVSFSIKSTSANPALNSTAPTTSVSSPTPAASASPTPAAVPSQQSQTQGMDTHLDSQPIAHPPAPPHINQVSNQCSSIPKAAPSLPSNGQPTMMPPFPSLYNSPSVGNKKTQSTIPLTSSIQTTSTKVEPCQNGFNQVTANKIPSVMPFENARFVPKTMPLSVTQPSPPVSTSSMSTMTTPPRANGHDHIHSPPSSGSSGGASSQKKLNKPKKIADIANKLHKRVSQTVGSQETPKRGQSPRPTKNKQQQLEFSSLRPSSHHESNVFQRVSNGKNSPMVPLGVAIKQGQAINSALFDRKSVHPNVMNGRLEEPLNLVTRDKDFLLTPGLTRPELPSVVK